MALRFVFGRSGVGKSKYLRDSVPTESTCYDGKYYMEYVEDTKSKEIDKYIIYALKYSDKDLFLIYR